MVHVSLVQNTCSCTCNWLGEKLFNAISYSASFMETVDHVPCVHSAHCQRCQIRKFQSTSIPMRYSDCDWVVHRYIWFVLVKVVVHTFNIRLHNGHDKEWVMMMKRLYQTRIAESMCEPYVAQLKSGQNFIHCHRIIWCWHWQMLVENENNEKKIVNLLRLQFDFDLLIWFTNFQSSSLSILIRCSFLWRANCGSLRLE